MTMIKSKTISRTIISSIIFLTLSSLATLASAADNVLMIFEMKNNFVVTSQSLLEGMKMAEEKYLDKKSKEKLNYILIKTTLDIKNVADSTINAIKEYKPVAIIGAISSNVAFVISDISEKEKIPFITPFATHTKVTENKEYTFRTCFDDHYQAKMLAKFVYKYKNKKRGVILLNETYSYALGLRDNFEKYYKELGGKIDDVLTFVDLKDVNDQFIQKIKKISPEFVFLPSYQIDAGTILSKLIDQLNKDTIYVGSDSWAGGDMFRNLIKQNKENLSGYYVQHWSPDYKSKENKEFLSQLEKHVFPKDMTESNVVMKGPAAVGYDVNKFFIMSYLNKKKNET